MSHSDFEASLSRRWRGNCFNFRSSISLGRSVPGACYSTERLALGFSDHQRLVSSRVPGWRLRISLSKCRDHPEGLLINGLLASLPKLIQQTAGGHFHQGLRRGCCWHHWSRGVTAGEPWAGNMLTELVRLRAHLSSYRGRRALGSEETNALFVAKSQYSVSFPAHKINGSL